ncbi:MAG: hypothetical protein AAGI23_04225 [Bacteroidota bacterium]
MKQVILLIVLCFTGLTTTHAQLGKLKDKLNKAKSTMLGESSGGSSSSGSQLTKVNSDRLARVDFDFESQPHPPAVAMHSLLSGVKLSLTGELRISELEVLFMPLKTTSGKPINFWSNYLKEIVIWADVIDVATQENKGTMHLMAYERDLGQPATTIRQKTGTSMDDFTDLVPLTEGNYELRFYVGGTHYYTHPFTVIKKTTDDPYAAMNTLYFLEGDNLWKDYVYFTFNYDEGSKQNLVHFHFHVENESVNVKDSSDPDEDIPLEWNAIIKQGSRTVGTLYWMGNLNMNPNPGLRKDDSKRGWWEYKTHYFEVYPRRRSGDRPFGVSMEQDLKDGNYRVELTLNRKDQPKEVRIYPFTVRNGKIQQLPETRRTGDYDPKRVLEQGPDRVFLKRKG